MIIYVYTYTSLSLSLSIYIYIYIHTHTHKKWSEMNVVQSCPTLCDPMDYTVWDSLGQNNGVGSFSFSRGSFQPRDWTQISCIAGGFFTSWATREVKNTGVGSLSLLQGTFPTQELNQGLLHCRWILYQLSYQGSQYI